MRSDADELSSIVLLRRAQDGDAEALDALAARYLTRLRRWTHGRLPNYARDLLDTEDLVQDAFLRTMGRLGHVEPEHRESVFAYFRQAVLNRIRDEIRRPHRIDALSDQHAEPVDSAASPIEHAIGAETLSQFERALEELSPSDRDCVMARIELDLSYEDISDLLGKSSPDAARVAVGRALTRLARKMARRER